jgi:large subunit ribosomal protein L4
MKVMSFTKSGAKSTTEIALDKAVFGREVTPELLKQSYLRTLSNSRQATAKTKTRGEIRGGGKKPWRQKGTGRARSGSIRNPLWRGGGTIFGPTGEQNYYVNMPKKAVRAGIAQALSAKSKNISVIDAFIITSGKTRDAQTILAKLKLSGNLLVIVANNDEKTARSVMNVPTVQYCEAKHISVFDIMNADNILIDKAGLEVISNWLGGKK